MVEIAKLSKSSHNNPLQQSIYRCDKRNLFEIRQVKTLYVTQ